MHDLSILYNPQPPTLDDLTLIASANRVISTAPCGNLTPDTHLRFQQSILRVLEQSPNPGTTAAWIIRKMALYDDGGGGELAKLYNDIYQACRFAKSSGTGRPLKGSPNVSGVATPVEGGNFSSLVKSIGLCRITGDTTSAIDSCHILAFSTSNASNTKLASYIELIRAMFGDAAWSALLTNVIDGTRDQGGRNINRLDNGIPMISSCHRAWDGMAFVLVVDWSTYSSETKEVRLNLLCIWIQDPLQLTSCRVPSYSLMLHSTG
jgi:hypothetical protein